MRFRLGVLLPGAKGASPSFKDRICSLYGDKRNILSDAICRSFAYHTCEITCASRRLFQKEVINIPPSESSVTPRPNTVCFQYSLIIPASDRIYMNVKMLGCLSSS